jgi:predicted Fe-Mo cluster-binding NifX family protein
MDMLGLVENMSGLVCPHCGKQIDLFSKNGAKSLSLKEGVRLLGSLPIEPEVVRLGDNGALYELEQGSTAFKEEFGAIVDQIVKSGETDDFLMEKKEEKEELDMDKIVFAVPVSGGKLCAHFGHCDEFALVETEDGKINGTRMHTPPPHEPGVLPRWLHEMGANIILAGGMGARAQELFNENGIKVVIGAPMDAPEPLVNQYLSGNLMTGDNICDH